MTLTTKEKLFELFTRNWKVKLICFAMALLLFLYRANTEHSIFARTISVPLTIKLDKMVVAASYNSDDVKVKIHGIEKDIKNLSEDDFEAYVDTSYAVEAGEYEFPIRLKYSDAVFNLDSLELNVFPKTIKLSLDTKSSRYLDVEPLYGGVPAFGYEVTSVTTDPSQILVSGAKRLVEGLGDVKIKTQSIWIDGAKASVDKTVQIESPNSHLTPAVKEVSVKVKISPIRKIKTFDKIPVTFINVPQNLEIAKKEEVSLTFEGNMSDLEDYSIPVNFVVADCSKVAGRGRHKLDLTINAPKYFVASKANPKTISVMFNESENMDENIKEGL